MPGGGDYIGGFVTIVITCSCRLKNCCSLLRRSRRPLRRSCLLSFCCRKNSLTVKLSFWTVNCSLTVKLNFWTVNCSLTVKLNFWTVNCSLTGRLCSLTGSLTVKGWSWSWRVDGLAGYSLAGPCRYVKVVWQAFVLAGMMALLTVVFPLTCRVQPVLLTDLSWKGAVWWMALSFVACWVAGSWAMYTTLAWCSLIHCLPGVADARDGLVPDACNVLKYPCRIAPWPGPGNPLSFCPADKHRWLPPHAPDGLSHVPALQFLHVPTLPLRAVPLLYVPFHGR